MGRRRAPLLLDPVRRPSGAFLRQGLGHSSGVGGGAGSSCQVPSRQRSSACSAPKLPAVLASSRTRVAAALLYRSRYAAASTLTSTLGCLKRVAIPSRPASPYASTNACHAAVFLSACLLA